MKVATVVAVMDEKSLILYGVCRARSKEDALEALQLMNGELIGSRRVRCGWAQHKTEVEPQDMESVSKADPQNITVSVVTFSSVGRQYTLLLTTACAAFLCVGLHILCQQRLAQSFCMAFLRVCRQYAFLLVA